MGDGITGSHSAPNNEAPYSEESGELSLASCGVASRHSVSLNTDGRDVWGCEANIG
jgi:hypothetical protein